MSLSTSSFEPDNIRRYIYVLETSPGKYNINISWDGVLWLLKASGISINETVLIKTSQVAIEEHICKKFLVDKRKSSSIRVIPYMVALAIFEVARKIVFYGEEYDGVEESSKISTDGSYEEEIRDGRVQSESHEKPSNQ